MATRYRSRKDSLRFDRWRERSRRPARGVPLGLDDAERTPEPVGAEVDDDEVACVVDVVVPVRCCRREALLNSCLDAIWAGCRVRVPSDGRGGGVA